MTYYAVPYIQCLARLIKSPHRRNIRFVLPIQISMGFLNRLEQILNACLDICLRLGPFENHEAQPKKSVAVGASDTTTKDFHNHASSIFESADNLANLNRIIRVGVEITDV